MKNIARIKAKTLLLLSPMALSLFTPNVAYACDPDKDAGCLRQIGKEQPVSLCEPYDTLCELGALFATNTADSAIRGSVKSGGKPGCDRFTDPDCSGGTLIRP